jgi:hypothetical protein
MWYLPAHGRRNLTSCSENGFWSPAFMSRRRLSLSSRGVSLPSLFAFPAPASSNHSMSVRSVRSTALRTRPSRRSAALATVWCACCLRSVRNVWSSSESVITPSPFWSRSLQNRSTCGSLFGGFCFLRRSGDGAGAMWLWWPAPPGVGGMALVESAPGDDGPAAATPIPLSELASRCSSWFSASAMLTWCACSSASASVSRYSFVSLSTNCAKSSTSMTLVCSSSPPHCVQRSCTAW